MPLGVRQHFEWITGQASQPFRMFPRTMDGSVELAATTLWLLGLAVGPVIAMAAIVGIGAERERTAAPADLLLTAMPLGYLVTFIGVVGYVYDRFMLAVVPFVVLLAVRGLDWALQQIPREPWRRAALAAVLIALLYPAVAMNARLSGDSRFGVEAWMQQHLTNDPSVLAVGSPLYLPNLYPYQHRVVPTASVPEILSWDAEVLVLNEDWLDRPGQPSDETIERDLTDAGYGRAYATGRTPAPGGLGGLVASGLTIDPLFSNHRQDQPADLDLGAAPRAVDEPPGHAIRCAQRRYRHAADLRPRGTIVAAYIVARAILVPLTYDEAATFFRYIDAERRGGLRLQRRDQPLPEHHRDPPVLLSCSAALRGRCACRTCVAGVAFRHRRRRAHPARAQPGGRLLGVRADGHQPLRVGLLRAEPWIRPGAGAADGKPVFPSALDGAPAGCGRRPALARSNPRAGGCGRRRHVHGPARFRGRCRLS